MRFSGNLRRHAATVALHNPNSLPTSRFDRPSAQYKIALQRTANEPEDELVGREGHGAVARLLLPRLGRLAVAEGDVLAYAAVRLAVVEEGLSHREAVWRFGIDRRTVKKMLSYSAPPGYAAFRSLFDLALKEKPIIYRRPCRWTAPSSKSIPMGRGR